MFNRSMLGVVLGSVLMSGAVAPQAQAQSATAVGKWDAVVVVSNGTIDIPFTFEIVQTAAGVRGQFINGDEKVVSQPGTIENGNVELRFDQYGAKVVATLSGDKLEGKYDRGTRGAAYPFSARRATAARPSTEKAPNIAGEWRIPTKSSKGESAWRFIVRQTGPAVTADGVRRHVGPIEYESDLQYPGAPASKDVRGGQTIRRLKQAHSRDYVFTEWLLKPELLGRLRQLVDCLNAGSVPAEHYHPPRHPRVG